MLGSLAPTPEFDARILEGRTLADEGGFADAEQHFLALLEEVRDQHPGNHVRALSSLITLYGRGGRYFEAYLLSRQLAEMCREAGPDGDRHLAFALSKCCGVLQQLKHSVPLGPALTELRRVLDRLEEPVPGILLEYYTSAATWALAQGDVPMARALVDAYHELVASQEGLELVFRWAGAMAEARICIAEERYDDAFVHIENGLRDEMTPAFGRLHAYCHALTVHEARGDPAQGRTVGLEVIEILESVADEAFLASDRIHQGTEAAASLEALGQTDLAARIHELVAAAILIRMAQLDASMKNLPELGLADASTTSVLVGFRKQFLVEQHALLERVSALLAAGGDPRVDHLLEGSAAEGFVAVCAWCESVRRGDGEWMPLGHYIPREGSVKVTHGICPPCAAGMAVESA